MLNSERANEFEDSSHKFKVLLEGLHVAGDSGNEANKPEWLNEKLFNEGRLFYKNYLFSVFLSEYLGFITGTSFARLLVPVIYTKNHESPLKSFRRLISTVRHLIVWFEEDVWDMQGKGYEDLMSVRRTHSIVSAKINATPNAHLVYNEMKNYDRISQCPFKSLSFEGHANNTLIKNQLGLNSEEIQYISQFDMALTQFLFIGIVLTHPEKVGLFWVTEKELEGFVHFWRGIGWLLGIGDEYNLCSGNLREAKSICREIEENLIKGALLNSDDVSFVMSDINIRGVNTVLPIISYPSVFLHILNTFDVEGAAQFRSFMTWKQYFQYLFMNFIIKGLLIFPPWISIFNNLLYKALCQNDKHVKASTRNVNKTTGAKIWTKICSYF